jgi:hypothetical protein
MNTYQITEKMLEEYRNLMIKDERVAFLKDQADEQLEEIATNEEMYARLLKKVEAPENVDNMILWIALMSDEEIVEEYIEVFDKDFIDMIPVCDLADMLYYMVYAIKVKGETFEGFDYLLHHKTPGMKEVDQHAVSNALTYIQKVKGASFTPQFL